MLKPLQIPSKFVRRSAAPAAASLEAEPARAAAADQAAQPAAQDAAAMPRNGRGAQRPSIRPATRGPQRDGDVDANRDESDPVAVSQPNYFNLHVEGVGYLNRVRAIKPKNGQEFLACSVSALRGSADEIGYTRFDCRVSGAHARKVVRMLESDVAADKRVMVGFRIADIYPELFTYERGEHKGQTGVAVRGRLLRIKFAKVDGAPVTLPEMPQAGPAQDGDQSAHQRVHRSADAEAVEDEDVPF
jgi:hypothetical protein